MFERSRSEPEADPSAYSRGSRLRLPPDEERSRSIAKAVAGLSRSLQMGMRSRKARTRKASLTTQAQLLGVSVVNGSISPTVGSSFSSLFSSQSHQFWSRGCIRCSPVKRIGLDRADLSGITRLQVAPDTVGWTGTEQRGLENRDRRSGEPDRIGLYCAGNH
jgi:hypothetical protein